MNTNAVPSIPGIDIPVLNLLPQSWQGPVLIIAFLLPYAGRFAHAMYSGSGVVGAVKGVLFGTNTPSAQSPQPTSGSAGSAIKSLILVGFGIGLAGMLVGCGTAVKTWHKSLYAATMLGDGAAKDLAYYWKTQTNSHGLTPQLQQDQSNYIVLFRQVGGGINVAEKAVDLYAQNVGTNTSPKAVIDALVLTAIQRAASFAAYAASVTGKTNAVNLGP